MNRSLVRIAHLGGNPDTVRRLVERGGWEAAERALRSSDPSGERRRELDVEVGARLAALAELDTRLVVESDDAYPAWLAGLPDRPRWLFWRGPDMERQGVAVVGSRRATRYGTELARTIGSIVGAAGWPVISGLAAGVDAAAHRGALDAGATTVAVLGSGIDHWYPRRNARLGEEVLASGGIVVSEFGPGVTPEPWRFPARNRIISGVSSVVIVVEAAVRSGALITARLAIEQGRDVMAVPGDVVRATSTGTNLLIRDGAHPITELDALVEELELLIGPAPGSGRPVPGHRSGDPVLAHLGETGRTLDELAELTGMVGPALLRHVGALELSGEVEVSGGFVRLRRQGAR